MEATIEVDQVSKRFGAATALDGMTFTVLPGQVTGFVGPNGAGKSTTMRVILGLDAPTAGWATVGGRPYQRLARPLYQAGVLLDAGAVHGGRPARDHLLAIAASNGIGARRVAEVLGLVGLDSVARRRVRGFSLGMKQRLGIAAIFVTHDQDEAFEMSDRVVLLNRGRVEQVGTPEELYDDPATRFAAEFIGETNLIEGVVSGAAGPRVTVETTGGTRYDAFAADGRLRGGDTVYVMIRPERIDLVPERPSSGVALPAAVVKRIFAGDVITFEVRTDHGLLLRSSKPSVAEYRALTPGSRIWAVVRECRALPRNGSGAA